MTMTILNSTAVSMTLGELNKNINLVGRQISKVGSGQRIVGAKDGASEYAISEKMRTRIRALSQADRNTQTGTTLLKVAEGGIQEQIEILKTIKERVLNAANDSNTDIDRAIIQKEIDQGYKQMQDIAYTTNYNGKRLLCGPIARDWEFNTWKELKNAERGVFQNETWDMNIVSGTVNNVKGIGGRTMTVNNQPGLGEREQSAAESTYDTAAVYRSDTPQFRNTTGAVGNVVGMATKNESSEVSFRGENWVPQTSTVTMNIHGTAEDMLNDLKNKTFTVTLTDKDDPSVQTTKTFTFADDLHYEATFGFSYNYNFKDVQSNTPYSGSGSGTIRGTVAPGRSYSGTTTVSLQSVREKAGGNATQVANYALGALADAIAVAFGNDYHIVKDTVPKNPGYDTSTDYKIYGESVSGGVLTLQSGEYYFEIASAGTITPTEGSPSYPKVSDETDRAKQTARAQEGLPGTYAYSYNSYNNTYYTRFTENEINVNGWDRPAQQDSQSNGATFGISNPGDQRHEEKSAYLELDIDRFINGITDVEDLIDQFVFKETDDELNYDADVSDTDPYNAKYEDRFDTGNNLVVDRSFTFSSADGTRSITYEFVDTGRDNTGKEYLYDEQKILNSNVRDLNNLRRYAAQYGDLHTAMARFLSESLDYVSYGRSEAYTRELIGSDGNPLSYNISWDTSNDTATTAYNDSSYTSAERIRLYAYQPYAGTESPEAASKHSQSPYITIAHRDKDRFSGQGETGNAEQMVTKETYLSSYDFDVKKWWNSTVVPAVDERGTVKTAEELLNGRGFRFYCANSESNTYDESNRKEWINIYFTDHSLEESIGEERPTAGNNMDPGEGTLDTIVVDIRGVENYWDLVRAIYTQANLAAAGGQSENQGQVGFESNPVKRSEAHTEYFDSANAARIGEPQHFQFAMDEERGILTVWDTDRRAHNQEMLVSDGVYDNIRLDHRDILEERIVIHDTDKSSQAVVLHIPRTTLDHVFGYLPEEHSPAEYNVMTKDMRDKLLGKGRDGQGILDKGLKYLTDANVLVGSQINRLEMSHNNLTTSVENVTGSESTIRDADMAREMVKYTRANVLAQASQSMLAHANQTLSSVLSLLQ